MMKLEELLIEKTDWNYFLRREMQLILPRIYLGPYSAATMSQREKLVTNGITHIICIRHQLEARFIHPNFPEIFKYLVINVADDPCANIIQHLPATTTFIDDALKNNGKVLVHGNNGISRSASVVIGYIMVKYKTTFREAYVYVHDRRCCIMPNSGFFQQLKEYEPIYKAQLSMNSSTSSGQGGICLKRTLEE